MAKDSIIAEVHRVKDALSAKYGHDVRRLGKALQKAQKREGGTVVSFPPRRLPTTGKRAVRVRKQPA